MLFKQRKLFWQIFPATLAILLFFIAAIGWYSSYSAENFYIKESTTDLVNRAKLIKAHVIEFLETEDYEGLHRFSIESGRLSETRITVVAEDGKVLADTNEDPESMDNHRSRPEISTAFAESTGSSIRFSNTLGERLLYSAILVTYSTENSTSVPARAVLRLSIPVTAVDAALQQLRTRLILGTLSVVIVAFIITLFVSRNISKPLEEMTIRAAHYSQGDFSQRMMIRKKTASREVAQLGLAMDQMADQLDEKISTIVNQRNQLETVFSSMVEAVIAVDKEERIVSINSAAAEMFRIDRGEAHGRLIQEVIRNTEIHRQIESVLGTGEPQEDEIVISHEGGDRFLQINAVGLLDGSAAGVGVVIVLNDVTKLRRLEKVRKDFIANVSHELRTPITSIRGYVETLLEGAIDDKAHAREFLEIVQRQSEQLSEIIDDLLILARIERDNVSRDMSFDVQPLRPALERAVQTCYQKAIDKEVTLNLSCDSGFEVKINETLFEQAIVNLVINAITYSTQGDRVEIKALRMEDDESNRIEIKVIDFGVGIGKEHLPRLFERFYTGDEGRNRKSGGTGLGLSIVKHIVQLHDGEVTVKSKLGEGSEFSVYLNGS